MPEAVPEPQTLRGCIAAQKECRKEIFKDAHERHTAVMVELGDIKQKLAFTAGQENGRKSTGQNQPVVRRWWSSWLGKALFTWGPFLLLVLFLGIKGWLEKMGWW